MTADTKPGNVSNNLLKKTETTAIILAGGLGTRLRSAVPDAPKSLAPVAGKPFLAYVIDHFRSEGIEKFIFSLGHMHEKIEAFLNSKYPSLNYQVSIEEEPLGTGGAIKKACKLAAGETVIVLNGDTLFKINTAKLLDLHYTCGAHCTLSLKLMKNFERYGTVELNKDYSIRSFHEKKYYTEGLINGGVYALQTLKFLEENLPEKFSFEKDYLEKFCTSRRMFGVIQDEYFIDIGIPEDYEKAQRELSEES